MNTFEPFETYVIVNRNGVPIANEFGDKLSLLECIYQNDFRKIYRMLEAGEIRAVRIRITPIGEVVSEK